jgi:predicted HicB family RNase H-like nuclease
MAFHIGKKSRPEEKLTEALAGGESDSVRMSFRLGRDLHTRLKLEAVRQGRSIIGMIETFVTEHTPKA